MPSIQPDHLELPTPSMYGPYESSLLQCHPVIVRLDNEAMDRIVSLIFAKMALNVLL